jgi:predicted MFS family arabinose efflux permease
LYWLFVLIFLCFSSAYFLSFALRQISAVLAPPMMAEFNLTNAQLGSLSSAYFICFALMQLPLGLWLDRFGSRKTHSVLLLFAVAGCVTHALATGYVVLWVGRALIGVGVSGALMAALRAFRYLYPAEKQQSMAAWMLAAGSLGALSTTLPVQWALPIVGWRFVFWMAAAFLFCSACAIFWGLPKNETTSSNEKFSSYGAIFSEPYFWRFGVLSIVVHGTYVGFQSLWIGPWLTKVLGLSANDAALILFGYTGLLMCGFLGLAKISARIPDHRILSGVCASALFGLATLLAVSLLPGPFWWWLWLIYALAGLSFTLIQTHVAMKFSAQQSGRALAAYNLLIFVGAFLAQWLFGVVVDVFKNGLPGFLITPMNEALAFRATMVFWVALQLAAVLFTLFWRVHPPSPDSVTINE